jgi:Holliday junction resolvasome RuvABC endonuclease subunit
MVNCIFSLDVSASSTGWCYTSDGKYFDRGIIKTDPKCSRSCRLLHFSNELETLLLKFKPVFIVQEDTFSGINIKTLKILSEFAGVSKLVCFRTLKIDPFIISNLTVKSYFAAANKEDLFNFTCELLEIKDLTFKSNNDIIDAQAQLLCYSDLILGKYKYRFDKKYGYIYMEDYISENS